MSTAKKLDARSKAREAMAERAKSLQDREREVERLTQAFYAAQGRADQARERLTTAETERTQAVRNLHAADLSIEEISELCSIGTSEVRRLTRTVKIQPEVSNQPAESKERHVNHS